MESVNHQKVFLKLYEKFIDEYWLLSKKEVLDKLKGFFIFSPEWKGSSFSVYPERKIIFGLKSKIIITTNGCFNLYIKEKSDWFEIKPYYWYGDYSSKEYRSISIIDSNTIRFRHHLFDKLYSFRLSKPEVNFIKEFYEESEFIQKGITEKFKNEQQKQHSLIKNYKEKVLSNFHKYGNYDLEENNNDFYNLIDKFQSRIINVDRNLVQKFIKLSNYLNIKKGNITKLYNSIKTSNNKNQIDEINSLLFSEVSNYKLLLFHSLNMITSLIENDMVTFYEIYESYDKLNIFNSNWENEVSKKLNSIDKQLNELNLSIRVMDRNIVDSLLKLSYTNKIGFMKLNHSVEKELKSINSLIDYNNLFTSISTYQLYKINKQTKGLK